MLAAFLFSFICMPIFAANDEADTVHIGMIGFPGYAEKDEEGNISGADVEYAYKIAETAGIKIKIDILSDTDDYFNSLEDGRVDMLFNVAKTSEREQKYLYAQNENGRSPLTVCVRKDDDRFGYGNAEEMKDILFGILRNDYSAEIFKKWCEEHDFTPHIREYPDLDSLNKALLNHETDAVLSEVNVNSNFRTILKYSATPYYTIFRNDSRELKNKIDKAMEKILSDDPLYEEKLLEKHTSANRYEMETLTSAEKEYIAEHPEISVAVIDNDYPYYAKNESGTDEGIIPDYYAKITELTGSKFRFDVYGSQDEIVEAVLNGKSDVVGMYSDGIITANDSGLRITKEYATVTGVIVTPIAEDKKELKTIAVKRRSKEAIGSSLGGEQGSHLVAYNNANECFRALDNNKVDAVVCGLPSATWFANGTDASKYVVSPLSSVKLELCGATSYGSMQLCGILNKAIGAAGYNFDGIVADNTLQRNTLSRFIAQIPPIFIVLFAVIMVAIVFALCLMLFLLVRRQKEKAQIAEEKAVNEREKIRLEAIEKSANEKNAFFSNISHDMRTPLNAVIGFSELARKNATSPEMVDALTKIQTSGKLLLDLINDTLTVSKFNNNKLRIKSEPVSIKELIASVVIPIREAAEEKKQKFLVDDSKAEDRIIMADMLNLQKILLNLLTNSVKYTPEGGTIGLIMQTEPNGNGKVKMYVCVADTGIGISADFMSHVFEPFIQEERKGYDATGTGLGLSIVKALVELMGGTIEVQSKKDRGTAFNLNFVFDEATEGTKAKGAEENSGEVDFNGKKILLCEDNELNREIACAFLKEKGIEVISAENGRKGVKAFSASKKNEFDAVLMDLRMPEMNGYERI